jgi:uncharacterized protein YbbC (DUF1343 family)
MRTIGLETFLPCTTLLRVLRDMKYSNDKLNAGFWLKYAKVLCLKSIFIFLIFSCEGAETQKPVVTTVDDEKEYKTEPVVGAADLEAYLPKLEGKSVGVVGNQSSLVSKIHLVDTLLSYSVNIKRVFSPEHGFRGDADAGEHVTNEKDPKTGLPIVSLYGKNKKPSDEQLEGIDVVLFDIQDVGVRFYTYISTLHYVMEACAENDIPVIILDRPNPNGHYVDGPILDVNFKSFVGMHPVPIVHGMTIGEYGQMINGEGWLMGKVKCDLTVIKCQNYDHSTPWSLEVPPSPNLRSDLSVSLYPSLCLLEATSVTVGRGTDGPFERYGHPNFPDSMRFSFTPEPNFGSKNPKHKGVKCFGVNLDQEEYQRMEKMDLGFLLNAHKLLGDELFGTKSKRMFYLLCGSDQIYKQMMAGRSEDEIKSTWQKGLTEFKAVRGKYLLYE